MGEETAQREQIHLDRLALPELLTLAVAVAVELAVHLFHQLAVMAVLELLSYPI